MPTTRRSSRNRHGRAMAATDRSTSPPATMTRLGPAVVTVLALSFGAVTTAFLSVFMMRKGMIPDLHWILGSGRYILDHGRLPITDIFSWSMADKPVLLYQWLFMALTAAGERLLGLRGLLLAFTALLIGIYLV